MVEDDNDGATFRLHGRIEKNPRKSVGNLLRDVKRASLIAGSGQLLILLDIDKIAEALGLPAPPRGEGLRRADEYADRIRSRSDAPERVHPFFLIPNLEGLLRTIRACDPTFAAAYLPDAIRKDLNARDIVLRELRRGPRSLRDCVRSQQPGLDALVRHLAALLARAGR